MTDTAPPGLLMVWTDIPAEVESDFNEWYNREHMPDRINKVPGFIRARRFVAMSGAPKYLALYETRSAQIFRSEPYLAINKDPDPTSRRFIPLFRNTIKAICDTVARAGQGEGAYMALMAMSAGGGAHDDAAFDAWVCADMLPNIVKTDGVIAATFARCNRAIQDIAAASYTRAGDRYADKLIAVETSNEAALALAAATLAPAIVESRGAGTPLVGEECTFRLLYTQHAPS